MPKVFASYFIVYVGIVVASVTAPAYEKAASIGTAAFWFGFVTLILLLILITYRYVNSKKYQIPQNRSSAFTQHRQVFVLPDMYSQ